MRLAIDVHVGRYLRIKLKKESIDVGRFSNCVAFSGPKCIVCRRANNKYIAYFALHRKCKAKFRCDVDAYITKDTKRHFEEWIERYEQQKLRWR